MSIGKIIFPNLPWTMEEIVKRYPKRNCTGEVTRIAPSPTGFFHLGTLYTALVNYIVAKQSQGIMFFRAEDTDQKRKIPGMIREYIRILEYYGIQLDEGPLGENEEDVGEYGPYIQSKRKDIYLAFIVHLLSIKRAYICFLTEEEIEEIRAIQEAAQLPTGIYKGYSPWRDASEEKVLQAFQEERPFVVRFKSEGSILGKIEVHDIIKGKVIMGENYQDIVIWKSQGLPTYHFAHVVDDYLMGTTLVIRGDEWFASLPLHKELFGAFGWTPPQYAHIAPLVKMEGESKRKLSKRKDIEADVTYYQKAGFLKEVICDYLCNLIHSGYEFWKIQNPGKHFLDFPFSLQKMNVAGALVDSVKMKAIQSRILKTLSFEEFYERLLEYLAQYEKEYLHAMKKKPEDYIVKVVKEMKGRIVLFSEWKESTLFFFEDWEYTQEVVSLFINPSMGVYTFFDAREGLMIARDILATCSNESTFETIKNTFLEKIQACNKKNGYVLWPLRVALSGRKFSPGALELVFIFGVNESIQKVETALTLLKNIEEK